MRHKTNKKNIHYRKKTRKLRQNTYSNENIIKQFLQMLNTVKLYHWHTYSYPQHKATDKLYDELNESIDNFVEVMLGKTGKRFGLSKNNCQMKVFTNIEQFKKEIEKYKSFLIHMKVNGSDLMNIRDEILAHLNKFTYLLTFR
jgi:DNA-binding ferritin-like protein